MVMLSIFFRECVAVNFGITLLPSRLDGSVYLLEKEVRKEVLKHLFTVFKSFYGHHSDTSFTHLSHSHTGLSVAIAWQPPLLGKNVYSLTGKQMVAGRCPLSLGEICYKVVNGATLFTSQLVSFHVSHG